MDSECINDTAAFVFWDGESIHGTHLSRKKHLCFGIERVVNLKTCCTPKRYGGLEIKDLRLYG
jgi:hypothetical protein